MPYSIATSRQRMEASCGQTTLKWLMLLFNLLFFVAGIGMITAGAVAHTVYGQYLDFLNSGYMPAPILLIVVGVVTTIVSFFGCCGAAKDHHCMLITFSCLLGTLFILCIAGGITAYMERGEIEDYLGNNMRSSLNSYNFNKSSNSDDVHELWDTIQMDMTCCGVNGFQDWLSNNSTGHTVPESCCKLHNGTNCWRDESRQPCIMSNSTNGDEACPIYTQGCFQILKNIVEDNMAAVGGVGIGIAFLQLLGVMMACFLAKSVRRGYTYA